MAPALTPLQNPGMAPLSAPSLAGQCSERQAEGPTNPEQRAPQDPQERGRCDAAWGRGRHSDGWRAGQETPREQDKNAVWRRKSLNRLFLRPAVTQLSPSKPVRILGS